MGKRETGEQGRVKDGPMILWGGVGALWRVSRSLKLSLTVDLCELSFFYEGFGETEIRLVDVT